MGRVAQEFESNLIVVLTRLLKWQYQPKFRSGSWSSIVEHRTHTKSPKGISSLKPYLEEVFAECYSDAVEQASAETGLPVETFPQLCSTHPQKF